MNLTEEDNHVKEELQKQETHAQEVQEQEAQDRQKAEQAKEENKNQYHTILLGIIAILFGCVMVLLFLLIGRGRTSAPDDYDALQKNITDYADGQRDKMNDMQILPSIAQEAVIVDSQDIMMEDENETPETEDQEAVSATIDKSAIVIDLEDENDVSYTKEFILREMTPYFAENNLEAIWDLAHLKRYVKLSAELKDTDTYYYMGDVDNDGLPDGTGLAIYEDNTYYYGAWSHGVRSGGGRWIRFYLNAANHAAKSKRYQSHSYAGQWSNDLPNGEGAEHYDVDVSKLDAGERILQNVVGKFADGLYDGEMYANTVDYIGNVEEWDGIASHGVFKLWRDMSSIGECSVWKSRKNADLCMDIDKSENKNQGLLELIDFKEKQ